MNGIQMEGLSIGCRPTDSPEREEENQTFSHDFLGG